MFSRPHLRPAPPPRLPVAPPPWLRHACAGWLALVCSTAMLPAAPSISIDGTLFHLAQADADSPAQLREYVPEGETLANWSRLIGIRVEAGIDDPHEYVERLAGSFVASHPASDCAAHQNRKTGQCAIDFLLTGDGFVEWNFVRATPHPDGGLEVVQYAMRFHFEHHAGEVNAELHHARAHLLPILADADFGEPPSETDRPGLADGSL